MFARIVAIWLPLTSGNSKKLTCGYHGRRFNLKGEFEHMPEFEETQDFPRAL